MRQIPFPRPSIRIYFIAAIVTGLSIAFILNVFQPFGTDRFQHSYKTLILTGYGIVASLTIGFYYLLSLNFISDSRKDKWTIIHETVDLFISMILGLLMCYFYFLIVFGHNLNFYGMIGFVLRAASVSLLPVLTLFAYLYIQYRDVKRSTLTIDDPTEADATSQIISLKGNSREDQISTNEENILYIKAEDNYVILHLKDGDGISRHMIRITMKLISDQLSEHLFFQCHRSHIINLTMIESIIGNKNNTKVHIMHIDKAIPVARGRVIDLRALQG